MYWLLAVAMIIVIVAVVVIWQKHSSFPAINTESELQARLNTAQPKFDLGEESLHVLSEAERLDSKNPMVWIQLGSQLCCAGYYEKALGAFERSKRYPLPIPQMSAIVDVWDGITLDALGRRQEAIAAYTKSLETLRADDRCDTPWFVINRDWVKQRLTTPFSPSMIHR